MKRYFLLAKNISKHSDYRAKVGAVLLSHGKPISVGFNKLKYSKTASKWNTTHAECSAINTSGKKNLSGSIMFIYRETQNDNKPALARPCNHCYNVLKEFGIKRIYYSVAEFPFWKEEDIK